MSDAKRFLKLESEMAQDSKIQIQANQPEDTALLHHFLRHYRGQVTPMGPQSSDLFLALERIRKLIKLGQSKEAEEQFQLIENAIIGGDLHSEFLLEKLRLLKMQNKNFEALSLSAQMITEMHLTPLTKMTVHQLRAHLYFDLKDYTSALEDAEKSCQLSEQFPLASSAFSSLAFYCLILNEMGQAVQSDLIFLQLKTKCHNLKANSLFVERLQLVERTAYRLADHRKQSDQALRYLKNSLVLSDWNQDLQVYQKSREDLKLKNESLINNQMSEEGLYWIAENGLLLDFNKRLIHRFKISSMKSRLLEMYFLGVRDKQEIFEKVWGLKYSKERHDSLLRSHIHLVKKSVPELNLKFFE